MSGSRFIEEDVIGPAGGRDGFTEPQRRIGDEYRQGDDTARSRSEGEEKGVKSMFVNAASATGRLYTHTSVLEA